MSTIQQDRNTLSMIRDATPKPGPLLEALLRIAEEGLAFREQVRVLIDTHESNGAGIAVVMIADLEDAFRSQA